MPYLKNIALSLFVLGTFTAALTWNAPAQDTLPAGEGKELVEKTCSGCHGIETALDMARTKEQWKAVVDTMIGRGAELTDKETETVVNYLTKNFGVKQ